MTERRPRFGPVDLWDPESDPAVRRLREALALEAPSEPAPAPSTSRAAVDPPPSLGDLRDLRDRAAAGDRSAVERLRTLLARFRHVA